MRRNNMKHPKHVRDEAEGIAEAVLSEVKEYGGAAHELAHQSVDGSENIIYYSKAWGLVTAARGDSALYDSGHDTLVEMGGDKIQEGETVDNVMVRLAYWILFNAVQKAVAEAEGGES